MTDKDQKYKSEELSAPVSSNRKLFFSETDNLVHEYPSDNRQSSDASHFPAFLTGGATQFVTPVDEYNAVYLSFWMLGAAFLAPWDAVLAVGDYWNEFLQPNVLFQFTIAYMMTNLIGLVFVVTWGEKMSFFLRIVPGLLLFIGVLIGMLFLHGASMALIATALICVLGASDAIVQGSVWALAGQFHPRFGAAVMSGNGLAGVIISAIQFGIYFAIPTTKDSCLRDQLMTRAFFGTCVFVIFASMLCYKFLLDRSPVTKYYLGQSTEARIEYATNRSNAGASVNEDGVPEAVGAPSAMQRNSIGFIANKVKGQGFNAFFTFFVTLSVYPAITLLIKAVDYPETAVIPFFPMLVGVFNLFDFIGRSLPRWDSLVVVKPSMLWIPVLLRVGFIPLFIVLKLQWIKSDLATIGTVALFALTNGYLGTLAMMFGPVPLSAADKEIGGTVMVFMLTMGLTLGVWTGTGINTFVPDFSLAPAPKMTMGNMTMPPMDVALKCDYLFDAMANMTKMKP